MNVLPDCEGELILSSRNSPRVAFSRTLSQPVEPMFRGLTNRFLLGPPKPISRPGRTPGPLKRRSPILVRVVMVVVYELVFVTVNI